MRGLILYPTMEPEVRDFSDNLSERLSQVQEVIGGYMEGVRLRDFPGVMLVHEDEKRNPHISNVRATGLALLDPRDYIAGTAVVFGPINRAGDETEVDPLVVTAVGAIYPTPAASPDGR